MSVQRKRYSADLKTRVALEAIKGQKTTNEIAADYGVHHRGRALDHIFVERLWRNVKDEEVYIKDYQSVPDAVRNLHCYFTFFNGERLHQALDYQTPAQVYLKG